MIEINWNIEPRDRSKKAFGIIHSCRKEIERDRKRKGNEGLETQDDRRMGRKEGTGKDDSEITVGK